MSFVITRHQTGLRVLSFDVEFLTLLTETRGKETVEKKVIGTESRD